MPQVRYYSFARGVFIKVPLTVNGGDDFQDDKTLLLSTFYSQSVTHVLLPTIDCSSSWLWLETVFFVSFRSTRAGFS